MPPAIGMAIAGIASGVGTGLAARSASRGATRAAEIQSQASTEAGDRQLEADRRAERFQREQAQREWREEEAARRANYDQWVARERRLGSIAERLGYGRREIPGYVPSTDPGFVGPPPSGFTAEGVRDIAGPMNGTGDPRAWIYETRDGRRVSGVRGRPGAYAVDDGGGPMDPNTRARLESEAAGYGYGGRHPSVPTAPPIPSVRDAILARRFPQGSVGATVLARRRQPAGAEV